MLRTIVVTVVLDTDEYLARTGLAASGEIEDSAEGAVELVCMMVRSEADWPEEGVNVRCDDVIDPHPLDDEGEDEEEEDIEEGEGEPG